MSIEITDEAVEQREQEYHSDMFSWSELVRTILHREAEIAATEQRALEAERRAEAAEVKLAEAKAFTRELAESFKLRDEKLRRLQIEIGDSPSLAVAVDELAARLALVSARAERAEQKHEAATKLIAKLKGVQRALEIYAKEDNWYEAEDGATHRQYFTIYPDGRRLHGWEIAQTALLAPQERGAEGAAAVLRKVEAWMSGEDGPLMKLWEDGDIGAYDDAPTEWEQTLFDIRDWKNGCVPTASLGYGTEWPAVTLYREILAALDAPGEAGKAEGEAGK